MHLLLKSSVVSADKAGAAVACRSSVSTAECPAVVRSSRARAERRPARVTGWLRWWQGHFCMNEEGKRLQFHLNLIQTHFSKQLKEKRLDPWHLSPSDDKHKWYISYLPLLRSVCPSVNILSSVVVVPRCLNSSFWHSGEEQSAVFIFSPGRQKVSISQSLNSGFGFFWKHEKHFLSKKSIIIISLVLANSLHAQAKWVDWWQWCGHRITWNLRILCIFLVQKKLIGWQFYRKKQIPESCCFIFSVSR